MFIFELIKSKQSPGIKENTTESIIKKNIYFPIILSDIVKNVKIGGKATFKNREQKQNIYQVGPRWLVGLTKG